MIVRFFEVDDELNRDLESSLAVVGRVGCFNETGCCARLTMPRGVVREEDCQSLMFKLSLQSGCPKFFLLLTEQEADPLIHMRCHLIMHTNENMIVIKGDWKQAGTPACLLNHSERSYDYSFL